MAKRVLPPITDLAEARKVLQEVDERGRRQKRLDPQTGLFGPQRDFALSPARNKIAVCSRRAGKSVADAWVLLSAAMKHERSIVPYITMSRATAKDIIWSPLQQMNDMYDLGLQFKQNSGDVVLPNKAKIVLRGAGSIREIDKLRGPKYPAACVDEAQVFGSTLDYILKEVLGPATIDYKGTILVTGTPNAACAGKFFELATNPLSGWEVHNWTIRDNPHIRDADEEVSRLMQQNGWTPDSPAYRREYLGEWVRDTESLVFALDNDRNVFPTFPEDSTDDWAYVLGVDIGYNDPCAFVVMAYSMRKREAWIVESYKEEKLIPSKAAMHVERLRERYPFVKIVVDTGGMGKGYAEEWKEKHQIPAEPAKKQNKLAYVEMFNGELRTGSIKIALDRNKQLIDEMRLIQRDVTKVQNGRFEIDQRFADHLCDAAIYASRECAHQAHNEAKESPRPGDKDYLGYRLKQIEKKIFAEDEPELPWWKRIGKNQSF